MTSPTQSLFYLTPQLQGDTLVLKWDAETSVERYLRPLVGKKLWAEFGKERGVRTLPANSYYWAAVLGTIANHTGHSETELHEIYKRMFLPAKFVKYQDKEIKLPASTTSLSKVEFGEYVDRVIAHAAELGITVPPPKE